MGRMMFSGHRGTRLRAIENTAAAFAWCIAKGLAYIERDVKKTRDGRIVVFHDERIDALLDGAGPVEGFSLEELRRFRYRDGQGIQTLEEFFEQVGKRARPMLEIKSRNSSRLVMELVRRYGYGPGDILIQSFDRRDIEECHALDPRLPYGLCLGGLGKWPLFRKAGAELFIGFRIGKLPVEWLNIDGPFIYDEFVDAARRRGLRIILGADNPERYFDKLDRWGVEIINADDGAAIRGMLEKRGG